MIPLADLPAESRPAPAVPVPVPDALRDTRRGVPVPDALRDTRRGVPVPSPPTASPPPAPSPPPTPSTLPSYGRETLGLPPPLPRLSPYGLAARAALGVSYLRLYAVPIVSGELELAFGGRVRNQSVYLVVDVERGRTEYGLHTQGWHVGLISEWSRGRFRYGFQSRVGAMFIRRATDHSDDLSSASFGLRGHIAWDLVRTAGGDALFGELAIRGDYYEPVVYGPSLMLGYRWESNRRLGGAR